MLEFVALVVLRVREPKLKRPFKAGNLAVASLLGVAPALLISYALYAARHEKVGSISALLLAALVALPGRFFTGLRLRSDSLVDQALKGRNSTVETEGLNEGMGKALARLQCLKRGDQGGGKCFGGDCRASQTPG